MSVYEIKSVFLQVEYYTHCSQFTDNYQCAEYIISITSLVHTLDTVTNQYTVYSIDYICIITFTVTHNKQ